MSKPAPQRVPTDDVLEWLEEHHPDMAEIAEPDRSWVWLPVDLRGEKNKALRESLKAFGFRWAKHGHPLPSGRTGTWGHAADKPIPFIRKGGGNRGEKKPGAVDNDLASEIDRALAEVGA